MKKFITLFVLFIIISCNSKNKNIIFDEVQAYTFLTEQCDFGPRNPSSEAIELERDYIKNILEQCNAVVKEQNFSVNTDSITFTGKI